MPRSGFGFND
jgi:hypothetical protein